tara:strand:+ start:1917 stop:2363 length:447 start_codon:yes stop_codon:yes gene_type:complete
MNTQNSNKKLLRGYISSREINGAYYPQNVQNLVLRNFAKENNIELQLSGTEWNIEKSFLMLRSIISEKNNGILLFSIFQIYENSSFFYDIVRKIIKKKKIIVFALENISISSEKELQNLSKIFKITEVTSSRDYTKNYKKIVSFIGNK